MLQKPPATYTRMLFDLMLSLNQSHKNLHARLARRICDDRPTVGSTIAAEADSAAPWPLLMRHQPADRVSWGKSRFKERCAVESPSYFGARASGSAVEAPG